MKTGRNTSDQTQRDLAQHYTDSLPEKLRIERHKVIEARHLTDAIVASIGDGMIIVDEYGKITTVNQAALDMLGYREEELIGEWLPKVLPSLDKHGNEMSDLDRPAMSSLLTGQPASSVTTYNRKDGSTFEVAGTASPFIIDGKPHGAVIIFRDFSQETAIENAKDEFVSLASHQLRTPLTAIRLYSKLIEDELPSDVSGNAKEHLEKIAQSTDKMLELVKDFLNIAKLELGKFDLHLEEVNLSNFIDKHIEDMETVLDEAGAKIIFKKPDRKLIASIDKQLLTQVLHNLTSNAIRYGQKNDPRITISLSDSEDGFLISVADNGIGIPYSSRNQIFQRLYRAPNAVESRAEGTGLGLYLVRKIIETLNGRIWFESEENKGTTFYIKLPKSNSFSN